MTSIFCAQIFPEAELTILQYSSIRQSWRIWTLTAPEFLSEAVSNAG